MIKQTSPSGLVNFFLPDNLKLKALEIIGFVQKLENRKVNVQVITVVAILAFWIFGIQNLINMPKSDWTILIILALCVFVSQFIVRPIFKKYRAGKIKEFMDKINYDLELAAASEAIKKNPLLRNAIWENNFP